jgi:drug/metabolite transporter (DMT)-like permease
VPQRPPIPKQVSGAKVSITVITVVLAAAALHAGWNAMAKGRGGRDALAGAIAIAIAASALALPLLFIAGLPDASSGSCLIASALTHVAYFLLLGIGYRGSDFSAAYPLIRGTAPPITTALAVLFLGETPSPAVLTGIGLVSGGVLGLSTHALRRGGLAWPSLGAAAGTIAIIVAYTLIDGVGARRSGNSTGYLALMIVLTGILLIPVAAWLRLPALGASLRKQWLANFGGGAMLIVAYGATLWAMTRVAIGAVAALRETSVLFAALIAVLFMGERLSLLRGLCALAIFLGLACMRLAV